MKIENKTIFGFFFYNFLIFYNKISNLFFLSKTFSPPHQDHTMVYLGVKGKAKTKKNTQEDK